LDEQDGDFDFNGLDQDTDPWEKDQRRGNLLNPKIITQNNGRRKSSNAHKRSRSSDKAVKRSRTSRLRSVTEEFSGIQLILPEEVQSAIAGRSSEYVVFMHFNESLKYLI
jgi:hypothetical protein